MTHTDQPESCTLRPTTLGSQVICVQCGPECECTVCLPDNKTTDTTDTTDKIYALWYGGYSYSAPDMSDLEVFDSVEQAEQVLVDRYWSGLGSTPLAINYADGRQEYTAFPCVDGATEMQIYYYDPRSVADHGDYPEPDKIIKLPCRHYYRAGLMYVHEEDLDSVARERARKGQSPPECEKCGEAYRPDGRIDQ